MILSSRARTVIGVALAALIPVAAGGCAAGAAAALAPTVMSATTLAAVHGARATQGDESAHETAERCEQVYRGAPRVEQVFRPKGGALESREVALSIAGSDARWTFEDGRAGQFATSAEFLPPLADMVPEGEVRYVAYAPLVAETRLEAEQAAALTAAFGPPVGRAQIGARAYGYTLAERLPCFESPQ
jgi:hypothetical protein